MNKLVKNFVFKTLRFLFLLSLFINTTCADYKMTPTVESTVIVDSFVQPGFVPLDVIVVLDRSCSMVDDSEAVGSGINDLASDITLLTDDYQIGFISADPACAQHEFIGPFDMLSSSMDIIMAPGMLSPDCPREEGFAALYTYMDLFEGDVFIRDDADLLIVFVSDEEEQSPASASDFAGYLEYVKDADPTDGVSPEYMEDVVAVTTSNASTCATSVGQKYIDLAWIYEKSYVDLCADDWGTWISKMSELTALHDTFTLSENPIQESIVVYVNAEKSLQFVYDANLNAVIMDETPIRGSLVEIGYKMEI